MNNRLAAVAILAITGIGFNAAGFFKTQSTPEAGDEVQILPEQIGAYSKTTEQWRNERPAGLIEEGAKYAAATGLPAQLDFYRHDPQSHNGLGCFLLLGETLLWEHVQRLPVKNGFADFDLGLAQTRESLRMVAASECRASGCSEVPLVLKSLGDFKKLASQLVTESTNAVVPVSIVLTAPTAERDPAMEAELMRQLHSFIANLDLEPARRVAMLQDGKIVDAAAPRMAQAITSK